MSDSQTVPPLDAKEEKKKNVFQKLEEITPDKEEQVALRDELKEILDELTYGKMMEGDAEMVENSNRVQALVPLPIFTG